MRLRDILNEGGNAIANASAVPLDQVNTVINDAIDLLPPPLRRNIAKDIGSAGFKKVPPGDIDLMIEASDLVKYFKTVAQKDPVKAAKKALEEYLKQQGYESNMAGRNVHVGIPFDGGVAQVDYMVIEDVPTVAPYHQHGPRGSYEDPEFKGSDIFILMNSIGKALGLKFDAFTGKLMVRDGNTVVAKDRDTVAKVLLNPNATADDLNSVKSMLRALKDDPERDAKLAQARESAAKGIMKLPGDTQ
jgi:hypothetical protein